MKYSFLIPVYNRPDEVDELLQSLTEQTLRDFEVSRSRRCATSKSSSWMTARPCPAGR